MFKLKLRDAEKERHVLFFLRFSAFSIPKLRAKDMLKERDEAEWFRIE